MWPVKWPTTMKKMTDSNVYINFNISIHNDDNHGTILGPVGEIAKTTKKSFSYKTKIIIFDGEVSPWRIQKQRNTCHMQN